MKRKHTIAGLLALLAVGGGLIAAAPGSSGTSTSSQLTLSKASAQLYIPDELLLKFKPGVGTASLTQSVHSTGSTAVATLSPGWMHIKLPPGLTVSQALAAYGGDPNVALAQPNYIYHALAIPTDSSYGAQWALKNTGQTVTTAVQPGFGTLYATNNPGVAGADLDIEPAWDHISDCSRVTVAVVDSGINYNHAELTSAMWDGGAGIPNHGWNYVNNNNDPMDLYGHGTHVAGIIGGTGNNGTGIAGVCWKASIMAVRVLDAGGTGTTATITQGVNFAVAHGAKVVNLSLGGPAFDQAFSDAITGAQTSGVLVVAAAGNDGANNDSGTTPTYPCNFPQANLLCVAALDQAYQLWGFSNYGSTSVDIGAPGANILNTWAGTSAVTTDPLTSGWTFTTKAGGGWAYQTLNTTAGPLQSLVDPTPFTGVLYNNSTDDRAYKTFNLTGNGGALQFVTAVDLMPGDHVRVAYKSTGGDPFSAGTTALDVAGVSTLPSLVGVSLDISGCISTTCSVGFQLQSDASGQALGVAIGTLSLQTLTLNTASFNTVSGTSLAAPHVVGVAAMLMAFNPLYTYTDVTTAIEQGGRTVTALAGKTTTGKAVDAMGALAYINPPTGLQVNVQP